MSSQFLRKTGRYLLPILVLASIAFCPNIPADELSQSQDLYFDSVILKNENLRFYLNDILSILIQKKFDLKDISDHETLMILPLFPGHIVKRHALARTALEFGIQA